METKQTLLTYENHFYRVNDRKKPLSKLDLALEISALSL